MAIDTAIMVSNTDLMSDLSKLTKSKKRSASPLEEVTKAVKAIKRSPSPHKPENILAWIEAYESEHKSMDGMKMALALLDLDRSSAKKATGGDEAASDEIANDDLDVSISKLLMLHLLTSVQEKMKRSEESAKAFIMTELDQVAEDSFGEVKKDEERFKAAYALGRDLLTCLYYKPELCLGKNDCRGYDFKEGERSEIYKLGETSKYDVDDENGFYNEEGEKAMIYVIQKLYAGKGDEGEVADDMMDLLESVKFPPPDICALFDNAGEGAKETDGVDEAEEGAEETDGGE